MNDAAERSLSSTSSTDSHLEVLYVCVANSFFGAVKVTRTGSI